jgi:hypothetical protein
MSRVRMGLLALLAPVLAGVPAGPARAVDLVSGVLGASSPTFNRRLPSDSVAPACNLSTVDSSLDGTPYAVFEVQVSAPENLALSVVAAGTTVSDTVVYLYCGPFDPSHPEANLVAIDDDDGGNALSAFTAGDGIGLAPTQSYFLVLTSFVADDLGSFQIQLTSATAHFVTRDFRSTGVLDAQSPVWDRIDETTVADPQCSASAPDSTANGVSYAVLEIEVGAPENLVAEVVDGGSSIDDTFLALYCGTFDPQNPLAGLVAADDDDGIGFLSALSATDGIALSPGQRYSLVLTTYSPGTFGTFEVQLASPTAFFVPEPGALGLGLGALAALGALRSRRGHAGSSRGGMCSRRARGEPAPQRRNTLAT